ncbi:MAG: peptidylprolyl isomerase [Candidatus Hydrogenedentes bacterium]|nr:peptidylprolyl isomerase [Candidatus Hydrogenedentota bacterium]
MTSEKKSLHLDIELENAEEPRDYTKLVWLGVIALFVVLGTILYLYSGANPQVSTVRLRHILVKFDEKDPAQRAQALTRIREIRKRILDGEDFGKLARDNSNDPGSASKGGDLGYVTKGMLAQAIDDYIWTAPIGQLSEIIHTQFGFHVVVVDDRQLSKVDELAEQQRAASPQNAADGAANP